MIFFLLSTNIDLAYIRNSILNKIIGNESKASGTRANFLANIRTV